LAMFVIIYQLCNKSWSPLMKLKLLGLVLCGTLAASQTSGTQQSPVNYQTRGETAMFALGECLGTNDKAQCQSQIQTACNAIKREAFRNSYTRGSASRAYKNVDREQRAIWETQTANLAMKNAGLGRNLCG
jgi:hypothetical protein